MQTWPIIVLELGKVILTPSVVLIITLVVGALMLWSPARRIGRWVTTISSILLLLCAVGPVPAWLARPLETRFPPVQKLPDGITGVILLGGAFQRGLTIDWNQPQLNSHAERLTAFLALARQYPNLQLVFSGGSPAFSSSRSSESDIARELFASLGMPWIGSNLKIVPAIPAKTQFIPRSW